MHCRVTRPILRPIVNKRRRDCRLSFFSPYVHVIYTGQAYTEWAQTAYKWHHQPHTFLPRCMQRGLATRKLSVCLYISVCQTRNLWQNERKLCPDFYIIWKSIYPSFLRRRMVGGRWVVTPSTWNFGSKRPRWSEIADFRSFFARSDSAVTPSNKRSIDINRKSTTRFSMSPRWTSYVP